MNGCEGGVETTLALLLAVPLCDPHDHIRCGFAGTTRIEERGGVPTGSRGRQQRDDIPLNPDTLRQATDNQGDGLGAPTGCQILFWREAQSNSTHTDSGGLSLLVSPCFSAYISKSTRLMRLSL